MKKVSIWNSIKERKYIISLLLISIIAISGYTFFVELEPDDKLCNLSNIYKMYNGGKIYNDCNVIITPIFFYVGLLLFKLLGANFITFGIYNIIIFTFIEYIVYKLFHTLNSNPRKSFIEASLILMYLLILVPSGANYNILVLGFVILGIILNIKYKNSKFTAVLQGIICFLTVFTKQNIGVFYILALIVYNVYIGITNKNIKQSIKTSIKEMTVFLAASILLLLFMHFNGNLNEFINYTVLGISEFAENNLSKNILTIIYEIFSIIFVILLENISIKILDIEKEKSYNMTILTIFGIAMIIYMYPIFNTYHFMLGNALIIIMIIYWLDLISEKINIKNKIGIGIWLTVCGVTTIIVGLSISKLYNIYKVSDKNDWIYKGIYISEETSNNINKICEYIQNKKQENIEVKIISYKAPLYIAPLKINNKEFDWPLNGNFGKDGYNGLIDKISKLQNTEILITKDEEDKNYQESVEVRKYIMENLEQIGEIEEFYIYKTINQ